MKQPVTARSVNYEMQLLKGVMRYAMATSTEKSEVGSRRSGSQKFNPKAN
jgi:hypothetical protein